MIYIFIAMIMYSVGLMFGVAASRHIDTNLAAFITNLMSTIIPLGAILSVVLAKKETTITNRFGIFAAVMCGASIAVFVMAINKAYSLNKVGIVAPVVFGGAILLTTIASFFIFKEKVSFIQTIGLIVLFIGLGLIVYARATEV